MSFVDNLKALTDSASEIELDQIDWEEPGTWPGLVKVASMILAAILVFLLCYFFLIKVQTSDLNKTKLEEQQLRKEFSTKVFEAANLDALREQMIEMNDMFTQLLNQLPKDTEVPGLLEDITEIGSANGLEFDEIELLEEITQEFYHELPINIAVTGTYHDLGALVSGIAALPRIVTLHDFLIEPVKQRPGFIRMSIVAKTYRYKDDEA